MFILFMSYFDDLWWKKDTAFRQICRKQNVDYEKEMVDGACVIDLVWVFNRQRNIQKL